MAWSSGNFSRSNGTYSGSTVWQQDAAAAVDIEADRHDTHDQDLAAGIDACLHKGGQNAMTANLDLGGYTITNWSGVLSRATLTNTTTLSLAEASPVLMLGASSGANLSFDTNSIQGRNNGSAAAIDINALGASVSIGPQSGTGDVTLYSDAAEVFKATAASVRIRDGSGATPTMNLANDAGTTLTQLLHNSATVLQSIEHGSPVQLKGENNAGTLQNLYSGDPDGASQLFHAGVAELVTIDRGVAINTGASGLSGRAAVYDEAAALAVMLEGVSTGNRVYSFTHGAPLSLEAENAAGSPKTILSGNPDGSTDLYYAGTKAFETGAAGIKVQDTSGTDPVINLADDAGTTLGQIIHAGGSQLIIRSIEHGSNIALQGEDASGTLQVIFSGDPDGVANVYYDGTATLRTASRTANDIGSGAQVLDGNGSWQPVGYSISPVVTVSANTDLRLANVANTLFADTASIAVDIDATTNNAKDGSIWKVVNISGGNVSITATSVVLNWNDGAGGATGNRTLADGGSCTIQKYSDGNYYVEGNGLS